MPRNSLQLSIRNHLLAVGAAGVILLITIGAMSAGTKIAGAIIASGSVVVESSTKKIQHPVGGVVKDLLVSEGQRVSAGDTLIRLDETVAKANLSALTKSYWELLARRARLETEREGHSSIVFPTQLISAISDPAAKAAMDGERNQLKLRRASDQNRKVQLQQRISQLNDEITGLKQQIQSKQQENDYIQKELAGVQSLWDQKLVSITRLTTLQREAARLLGDKGQLTASIAQAKGKISETELQILQVDEDNRKDVAKELSEVRSKIEETYEKRVAAQDTATKLDIRSPQNGIVHDLVVHTGGAVISPAETIMVIVPDRDNLVVEAHVTPQDIEQVKIGQRTSIRFPNFNQRTTPEIRGKVTQVGADISRDDKSTPPYFTVRVKIDPEAGKKLDGKLVPGMPAELFIETTPRTVLSYLMKPLADQARRAFREK